MYKLFSIKDGICAPEGFYADGIAAGLKPNGERDLASIYSDSICDVCAVFTTNRFAAAPIHHFRKHDIRQTNFVLINAKNANAMTGEAGVRDIEEVLESASSQFGDLHHPVMSSTGVIGVPLPVETIVAALSRLDRSAKNGTAAAEAIMTTDRYPKQVAFEVHLDDGRTFRLGAMAKGAGMIDPAMATMLCFVTTDAAVPADRMRALLREAADRTFNAVSVDGDRSTNDTVMLLANGRSNVYDETAFQAALERAMHELALQIVADGEGAGKCVAFEVTGARSDEEAALAARALSRSLLVKTALHGEDPNWGRIASTIGASGADGSPETLRIAFGEIVVYDRGEIRFDAEQEAKAAKVMKQPSFAIRCDLGVGEGQFTAYGCDLGHEYIRINADYRT